MIRLQTPTEGPLAKSLDLVARSHSHWHDVLRGLNERDKKGRVVRVVDQKTAVVPLHADTLADPNKLLASIRSLVDLA